MDHRFLGPVYLKNVLLTWQVDFAIRRLQINIHYEEFLCSSFCEFIY